MDKRKIGVLLLLVGLFILLNTVGLISDDFFMYLLSAGFLITYFLLGARKHYRNIGFLIPASILLALALFSDLQRIDFIADLGGGFFFIILGLAFVVIFIHTLAFEKWDWPIYPASALIIFGVFAIFIENSTFIQSRNYLNYLTPAILIISGIIILYIDNRSDN